MSKHMFSLICSACKWLADPYGIRLNGNRGYGNFTYSTSTQCSSPHVSACLLLVALGHCQARAHGRPFQTGCSKDSCRQAGVLIVIFVPGNAMARRDVVWTTPCQDLARLDSIELESCGPIVTRQWHFLMHDGVCWRAVNAAHCS
jgi:hypothetical protein